MYVLEKDTKGERLAQGQELQPPIHGAFPKASRIFSTPIGLGLGA